MQQDQSNQQVKAIKGQFTLDTPNGEVICVTFFISLRVELWTSALAA